MARRPRGEADNQSIRSSSSGAKNWASPPSTDRHFNLNSWIFCFLFRASNCSNTEVKAASLVGQSVSRSKTIPFVFFRTNAIREVLPSNAVGMHACMYNTEVINHRDSDKQNLSGIPLRYEVRQTLYSIPTLCNNMKTTK